MLPRWRVEDESSRGTRKTRRTSVQSTRSQRHWLRRLVCQHLCKSVFVSLVILYLVCVHCLWSVVDNAFFIRYENGKRCERLSGKNNLYFADHPHCFSTLEIQQACVDLIANVTTAITSKGLALTYWLDRDVLLHSYGRTSLSKLPLNMDMSVAIDQSSYAKLLEAVVYRNATWPHHYDFHIAAQPNAPGFPKHAIRPVKFLHRTSGFFLHVTVFSDRVKLQHGELVFGPPPSTAFANCLHCLQVHADRGLYEFKVPRDWVFPLQACTIFATSMHVHCPGRSLDYLNFYFGVA